jgi:hypothetical protein
MSLPVDFAALNVPARGMTPFSAGQLQSMPAMPASNTMSSFNLTSSLQPSFDQSSPEMFRQNIAVARDQVASVQGLARSALEGIENAYRSGVSPAQTSGMSILNGANRWSYVPKATIAATVDALKATLEFLRQTGTGGLLLLLDDQIAPPSEADLLASTTTALQADYERNSRVQESAGVVANLLSTTERK